MSASPDPHVEQRVGGYRLLARIGEGGMGVVHLAQGPDGRRVALKVLRPHIVGDREARERLAREVSSLRRITSPRIAEILDADPHGPTPYVVTRYVPGLSLYHHLAEEGVVAGRDLLHLAAGLAEALAAVHAVGVVHRDIKPTNVLMEGRSPVLIDFGLARVAEDPRLTQTGFLLGTPGYLAPEILYGDDATPASDVHAWAATVVFAATGRAPYGRGPAMAVLDRVRRGQHDLAGVPEPLAGLLRDCLAPEAWERPSLPEVRAWLEERRVEALTAAQATATRTPAPEQELWTRPFYPAAQPAAGHEETPHTRIAPLGAPLAAPAPAPASAPAPVPAPVPMAAPAPVVPDGPPHTRIIPAITPDEHPARAARDTSRVQRTLQLAGLGALTAATVAYAPYAGTALVGVVVLVLRTVSVTRQRHGRRQLVRGRARWYDVPTTTLSLPVYLALGLVGAIAALLGAAFVALALFSLGYLLGQSPPFSLALAGVGFVPALWWGFGAARLRETTRALVARTARSEYGGWFVAVMCALGTAVLLGVLVTSGANWTPAVSAPWHRVP